MRTFITAEMGGNADPALVLSSLDGTASLIIDQHHDRQLVLTFPDGFALVAWANRVAEQRDSILRFARAQGVAS